MPVISTDADRKADARLAEDKADWYTAHKIAVLKTNEERHQALESVAMNEQTGMIDEDFYEHIKARATQIFMKRKRGAETLADKASQQYQKGFKTSGKVHTRQGAKVAKTQVAALLNKLDQGVNAA